MCFRKAAHPVATGSQCDGILACTRKDSLAPVVAHRSRRTSGFPGSRRSSRHPCWHFLSAWRSKTRRTGGCCFPRSWFACRYTMRSLPSKRTPGGLAAEWARRSSGRADNQRLCEPAQRANRYDRRFQRMLRPHSAIEPPATSRCQRPHRRRRRAQDRPRKAPCGARQRVLDGGGAKGRNGAAESVRGTLGGQRGVVGNGCDDGNVVSAQMRAA